MIPNETEESLRRVQAAAEGVDPDPAVIFCDARYEVLTADRLGPVLRYASTGQPSSAERAKMQSMGDLDDASPPSEQLTLAAAHQLLEDTLADFTAFSNAALDAKVRFEDVRDAVLRVIEVISARPAMAALRLLRYVAASLAEMDGALLLAGGRGVAGLSVREACNAAYARLLEGVEPDRRAEWIEDLYLDYDPGSQALEMVRRMQAEQAAERAASNGHPVE